VILFNFVFKEMPSVGAYFVAVDVLFPSFIVAMLVGFLVSKKYPPRKEAIDRIDEIDATIEDEVTS
jgi:sodium/proline symporter